MTVVTLMTYMFIQTISVSPHETTHVTNFLYIPRDCLYASTLVKPFSID